jgi:hypothetical protein
MYTYSSEDELENLWHLACWVRHDPEGPTAAMAKM